MQDLSLHILDIVENSITAGADRIRIRIVEDLDANLFLLEISDNGRGMDKEIMNTQATLFILQGLHARSGWASPCWPSPQETVMGI